MTEIDYAGWAAVRSISEAVTRTKSIDRDTLYNYLISDQFELAAFKGRPLSFRNWNGQLRQSIPLVHPHGLVTQSPQEGYLHPVSELDTLGFDKTEVTCDFN
jgi:ABC transporter substrate binding protein (PQQ-dependent alcohol dehydrogenase system)